jgi:hypothetical protein
LGIQTQEVEIKHAKFNDMRKRWMSAKLQVPIDMNGKPILLVPKRFLDELPALASALQ